MTRLCTSARGCTSQFDPKNSWKADLVAVASPYEDSEPAPPNYPLRHPKYDLTEAIRLLIEVHWGVFENMARLKKQRTRSCPDVFLDSACSDLQSTNKSRI